MRSEEHFFGFLNRGLLKFAKLMKEKVRFQDAIEIAMSSNDVELCFVAGLLFGSLMPDEAVMGFIELVEMVVGMLEKGKADSEILETLDSLRKNFTADTVGSTPVGG